MNEYANVRLFIVFEGMLIEWMQWNLLTIKQKLTKEDWGSSFFIVARRFMIKLFQH